MTQAATTILLILAGTLGAVTVVIGLERMFDFLDGDRPHEGD